MRKIICWDAGHGGRDPGAVGPNGTEEKNITLAVALQAAEFLQPVADSVFTRTEDVDFCGESYSVNLDLQNRVQIANNSGANYFVSVHCNSADDARAKGTESYCWQFGGQGEKLAEALQKKMIATLELVNRGVKEANFYVLRNTVMPASLVELAFISNPSEEELLNDPEWQREAAWSLAAGVADFLGESIPPLPAPGPNPVQPTLIVAGKKIENVELIGDTLWASIREMADALNRSVTWDGNANVVKLDSTLSGLGRADAPLALVEQRALVGRNIEDRVYVPVRPFAEALNLTVTWDPATKTAKID
ncbi:N-acetylmuramoyl-L-alanine amidase [Heliobacterium mobile]|nr:N-acetylmuramoyl-L-alanine amidase [Heliobacterium mobile]